jgi:iron complex transport system substrate-binding protein
MARFLLCIGLFISLACSTSDKKFTEGKSVSGTTLRYAKGFSVTRVENAKLVEVLRPYQGATSGFKYLLVKKGQPVPSHDTDTKVIITPISSIVCTSTTHIPLMEYLEET